MSDAKRPVGRPRKNREDPLCGNITFRTVAGLRGQLRAAAAASGRSMSEEVTFRLQQSFQQEDIKAAVKEAVKEALRDGPI